MKQKKTVSDGKKFFWNMFGSMCNALSSFVLLTIVTRTNGSSDGGVFSLAFSTAQMLTSVGCFETRAIQVTNVKKKLEFKDYLNFRVITTILMMAGLIGYLGVTGKKGGEAAIFFFIALYKGFDCLSDAFQGLFQLEDRIDLSGKSLGIRVVLSTVGFAVVLLLTHNLLMASIAMCIIEIVFMAFFDWPLGKEYAKAGLAFHKEKMISLFRDSLPLFIGSFMIAYMVNASKYSIDKYMSDTVQNYYGFLLMPAFVINLFSLFFFRPLLTPMAVSWDNRDKKGFLGVIQKSMIWIGILTVGAVIGAYLLGIPILNLISGLDLMEYRMELVIVMLGGSMNAVITVLYYVLAVWRKQYWILGGYGVGFVTAFLVTPLMVKGFGITGAVTAYVIPMAMTAVTFFIMSILMIRRADWRKIHE